MNDDIASLLNETARPRTAFELEFQAMKSAYHELKPLSPEARSRVISHVMGMLKSEAVQSSPQETTHD